MIESPEIKNIILQLYGNEGCGGFLAFAEQFYSSQESLLVIGTDPDEWLLDRESVLNFYKASADTGVEIQVMDLEAYSENTVGWAIDRVKVKLPINTEFVARHTFILHKENEEWKIVHSHASMAVPNDIVLSE